MNFDEKQHICPILSASGKEVYCKREECAWFNPDFGNGECSVFTSSQALQHIVENLPQS